MPQAGRGLLDHYITSQQRRGLTETTLIRYEDILRRFELHCGGVGTATRDDVNAFLDSCRISMPSRGLYLTVIGVFYRWCVAEGLAETDPTTGIPRPLVRRRLPRPIDDAGLARGLAVAGVRMRCWILLGALEGLRAKEIAGVHGEDVQPFRDPPLLVVAKGKGDHMRAVPLHDDVLAALKDYGLPIRGPIWRRRDGREVTGLDVTKQVAYHFRQRAGVEATCHNLRHWFATQMYAKTRDIRLVQELLGHQDPATTAKYTRITPLAAADVVQTLTISEGRRRPPGRRSPAARLPR